MKTFYTFIFSIFITSTICSQVNGSLNFDGVDDFISFDNATQLTNSPYTIELLVKKDIGTVGYVVSYGADQNTQLNIGWVAVDTFTFGYLGSFQSELEVYAEDDGLWHHWTLTYNVPVGGQFINRRIYKDGILVASDLNTNYTGTNEMSIGKDNVSDDMYFKGSIDIVRFWNIDISSLFLPSIMIGCTFSEGTDIDREYRFSDGVPNADNSTDSLLLPSAIDPNQNGTLHNFDLTGTSSNWIDDAAVFLPAIIDQPQDQDLIIGEQLVLTATVANLDSCGNNKIEWQKDGNPLTVTLLPILTIDNATYADGGDYSFRIYQTNNYTGGVGFELYSEIATVSALQIEAKDSVSDYFIDVDWSIPVTPCLFDSNGNPYDEVTIRLLRDGDEIFFQTYEDEELAYFYTNNTGIIGTYRDYVGSDQNNIYEMMVYVGPFGQLSNDCGSLQDTGSTSLAKDPTNLSVSTDLLDRITISWLNNSDLATSYKLFRNGNLIATFLEGVAKDSLISFTDTYNFFSSSSIVSGEDYTYSIEMNSSFNNQTWDYTLGTGSTPDIGFLASKTDTNRVALGWQDSLSTLIDEYRLYRNNNLHAVKATSQTDHIDAFPYFGDAINYQIRLVKEDTIRAAYNSLGYVMPNGSITGRVLTEEGQFPVKDVTVHAIRHSTNDSISTTTNTTGDFSFAGLSYGLLDSFTLQASHQDTLPEHNFSYFPNQNVGILANNPNYVNALILDDFTYPQGTTQHALTASVVDSIDKDFALVSWEYTTDSDSIYLDVSRNGDIIYATTDVNPSPNTTGSFKDLDGTPNEDTKYQIRIYDIVGGAVSSIIKKDSIIYPKVSKIPNGNFTLSQETVNGVLIGNVVMQWAHTSQNIDGFRIYRNKDLIAEVSNVTFDYTDTEAPFDSNLFYTITAVRNIDNTTYETEVPTASMPTVIALGAMASPNSVVATAGASPYLSIEWTLASPINTNFNFTGYCIYRNGILLRKQDKSLSKSYFDVFAAGMTNVVYEVSLYRATENGMIESARISSNTVNHPSLYAPPTLAATQVPAEGLINLLWINNLNPINADGYQLFYNGVLLAKLPLHVTNYKHFPKSGTDHDYELFRYKTINLEDILSTVSSTISVNMGQTSGTVYPPQNLTASRNLPNHVKLCWEYLDFIESSFEVVKNNTVIATLPVGARTYYDHDADPSNHMIDYRIRAVNSGQLSKYVGAVGDVVGHKLIYGQVTDPDTKLGIEDVSIYMFKDGIGTNSTKTDSSGYFSISVANELVGDNLSIFAEYSLFESNSSPVTISAEKHYEVNIELDIPEIFPYTSLAEIEYADVDIDIYELSGNISWQPTNTNYDGVEVSRGLNVLADIPKVDENLFIDTAAVPGITYRYIFRTYQITNLGKVFSDFYTKEIIYPPIAPVINLSATPLLDENAIQVQWSHLYDHSDGYAINRNGVFIKAVMTGNPFTFIDSTGTSGEQYTYTLVAFKENEGQVYFSEVESVTVTYPKVAPVKNFVMDIPFIENVIGGDSSIFPTYYLNHVELSWDYEAYGNNGFNVFRDDQLIATIPADSFVYKDFNGIPSSNVVYAVSAISSQNGVTSESEKVELETVFPALENVYELTAISRPDIGDVTVNWKYRTTGVDYFKLIRAGGDVTQDTIIINVNNNILDETTFEFIDKTSAPSFNGDILYVVIAYSERDDIVYESGLQVSYLDSYPYPPLNSCSASQGTYDNAVKLTWQAPLEANIDSFTIYKYKMPENIYDSEFTVDKGKRSYMDVFGEGETIDSFNYQVITGRIVNGNYMLFVDPFTNSPCISLGYPKSANESGPQVLYGSPPNSGNPSEFGGSVAIDNEWMAVGNPSDNTVNIYKFENELWIYKQHLFIDYGSAVTRFGSAIDIDGKIMVIGAPETTNGGSNPKKIGAAYFLRLNGDTWEYDQQILGTNYGSDVMLGSTVAVDNDKIVLGYSSVPWSLPQQDTSLQKHILVFARPGNCTYENSCTYTPLPVSLPDNLPELEFGVPPYYTMIIGPSSIDIEGNDIVLGYALNQYKPLVGPNGIYGAVAHLTIGGTSTNYQALFTDQESVQNQDDSEFFGWDVETHNGNIAVTSVLGQVSNVNAGKVTLYEESSNNVWEKYQTLTPHNPVSVAHFGWNIEWKGDYLGVLEPYLSSQNSLPSKLYLYKENTNSFDIVHSPDPSNEKFRADFYDSGNPDIYPDNYGYSFDISDNHVVVGSPSSSNPRAYSFDLFNVEIENLSASDGTLNDTKIEWDLGGCEDCPVDYIDSYNIYRDAELIGNISATMTQFFDQDANLEPGVSLATAGKEYIYEVEAVINAPSTMGGMFDHFSPKSTDVGYSKRKGKLSGDVFVSGTTSGVPGVSIVVTGISSTDQSGFTKQTTSLSDGSFVLNDLYVGSGTTYTMTASYLEHDLDIAGEDEFLLTPDSPEENFIVIFDNTAFVVEGRVKAQDSECGLSGLQVDYYQTINGIETLADTTSTNEDGFYSMIVNPNISNLTEIKIKVENLQSQSGEQGDSTVIQYDFSPVEKFLTNLIDFPVVTTLGDFVDTLTYPVTLSVENTCGFPLADQPVLIRVSSDDYCYEYNAQTDNDGVVNLNLTPKKYLLAVEGIVGSGVDNYENAGIDFLSLRPVTLDLLSIHTAADSDSDTLPTIDPVKFIYHRAVNFAYTTSFDKYLCGSTQNPAILERGMEYSLDFILSENHRPGESCNVTEGYIIVRNSGATKVIETINIVGGGFETYNFTAGLPNLVAPHTLAISLQYFSDNGSLLGSKIIPIIVEGQRLLPGTGIVTDALTDEAGDLQMPLLVLRDPPGDGSYSTIESGSTITKSLDFSGEASGSLGFYLESEFTIFTFGGFSNLDVGVGGSTSNGSALDFSITTTQAYSTSDSEDAIGRGADVIVGAGISNQYGLSQELKFINDCEASVSQILSFGVGGFNSTYGYTVSFIEGLIDGYRRDSLLVELDLKTVVDSDGNPYSKVDALGRFTSLIKTWEEMLHYHDVETVPHYVLCQDLSYRDDLYGNNKTLYEGWRNGFCNQIGEYDANDNFTMNDEIIWTPALISAYNNSIAFTDSIKGLPKDFIDNGDLDVTQHDITSNNLSLTNQFHNSLGNAVKSAEVFDLSGNVNFDRTVTAQQSSSTFKAFSRYFYMNLQAGAMVEAETNLGFVIVTKILGVEAKIGVSMTTKAEISVNKSQSQSNESTISYHIFDDDPEDQVTFLALQAPIQDQTPYFIRLGGLSSCPPEEALTINQDNSPLLIDDPTILVIEDGVGGTATPFPVHGVEADEAAIFEVQMGNLGPTGLTRDAKVFLDLESNPFGAIVKIGGSNLNISSPVFSIPEGSSITQFLTIERPNGTPFYVFEGLRIGIKPECGGESKFITLDVYFKSPCSPVSITKPFEGLVINRINPFIANDSEVIPYELRDFQADNVLLEYVQLQYKRLGTGTDWQNVPGGRIERQTLADHVATLADGQDPLYFFEWDITGQYNLYPDGQYKVRAFAFCGVNGRQYSNESEITLARSGLLITGYPEPADGRWTVGDGDEISTTYSTDIDCGIYNVLDNEDILAYLTLVDLETMMPVAFTHECQNNKLTIIPNGDMSLHDGRILRASYTGITNIIGNKAQDVIWDFEVITQLVDWEEQLVEVTLFANEVKTVNTFLFNTTSTTINGLSLSGTESWYSYNPSALFYIYGDATVPVELTFDGSIGVGSYTTTLHLNGMPPGTRTPSILIKLNVLQPVPTPTMNETYTDSMELVTNWSFLTPLAPSIDVNDVIQVYKDGLIRGYANIEEQGNFYFSRIKVYGNVNDEDGQLDFVIWNADEAQGYIPISNTNISFEANTVRGVLTNPEILLVEDDLYEFGGKIYVDSMNVAGINNGLSWETAFADLQDALAIANDTDTIWMAGGTYYPSTGVRSESFVINEAIAILGGFQNGMTSASQRTGNDETILSGNIGIKAAASDNSYHVVKSSAPDILIDMLTISDGNADGPLEDGKGGCLYNTGDVSLINCRMSGGQAMLQGALMYNNVSLIIDGGAYYFPAAATVSNLHNDVGGLVTIKQNVQILEE